MDIVERYNLLLRTSEDGTIRLLNRILERSFQRILRRTKTQIRTGNWDRVQRGAALSQEFRQLIPTLRPDKTDAYDRLFRELVGTSQSYGLVVADELTGQVLPATPRVDVTIPIEATYAAAQQARGYLTKHGELFARRVAQLIGQGIAEGRSTDAMVMDARTQLNVVRSRAEAIVRTESLRAYNEASNTYYASQGIELVMYYATADDRSCRVCAPRAGVIYKRGEVKTPVHPRCRCYLAPWSEELAAMDETYAKSRQLHKKEVEQALLRYESGPFSLNKAAVFEQLAPTPYAV